jgi:hypothetical protein
MSLSESSDALSCYFLFYKRESGNDYENRGSSYFTTTLEEYR